MKLIHQNSVLRRIPPSFEPHLRISVASIAACIDIIEAVYGDIYKYLTESGAKIQNVEETRTRITALIWSLVDNYDMIRQLLNNIIKSQPSAPPYFLDFLSKLVPIRSLRNSMDHLGSNVKNLAKAKKQHAAPLHGNLGYTYTEKTGDQEISIYLCGFGHGLVPPGGIIFAGQNPDGTVKIPIDKIEFHAFDIHIRLDNLYDDFLKFVSIFVPESEKIIHDWVLDVAVKNDVPIDEIYGQTGAIISCAVAHVGTRAIEGDPA